MSREACPRMKGVELYSWNVPGIGWAFALLDGTNRRKSVDEVKGRDRIVGLDALAASFSSLALGETVVWVGWELPPEDVVKAAERAARNEGLTLVLGFVESS